MVVEAFGRMGPEHADHALPVLTRGLSDPDRGVRIHSVHAARGLRTAGRDLLLRGLGNEEWLVRWWAVQHLGGIDPVDEASLSAVDRARTDAHEFVRLAAERAKLAMEERRRTPPRPSPSPHVHR